MNLRKCGAYLAAVKTRQVMSSKLKPTGLVQQRMCPLLAFRNCMGLLGSSGFAENSWQEGKRGAGHRTLRLFDEGRFHHFRSVVKRKRREESQSRKAEGIDGSDNSIVRLIFDLPGGREPPPGFEGVSIRAVCLFYGKRLGFV